ncbi:unnamed protein product [marine sediment metagenome]|uniref:Bacterial Ig-like domain-containing protein n=1 Tax=marine sediment metagenome TaxID=412755 RepID=X1QKL7_9ZZZZ
MRVLSKLKKPKATRIIGGALGLLLALSLVLVPAAPALAVPPMPHQFWGTVTIGTGLAPEGTIVSAQIGETEYASTTVDAEHRYGYRTDYGGTGTFMVPADDLNEPGKDGGVAGDTVEFYVDGVKAALYDVDTGESLEGYTFEIWGTTKLNLTVTIPDSTAPTVEINSTATSPTSTSPIPMTATFSEDVTGFELGDITVGNGTAGSFAGSGADYTSGVTVPMMAKMVKCSTKAVIVLSSVSTVQVSSTHLPASLS